MNILITGGDGYIATSLHRALKDKYTITTITRKDFDLTDYAATCKFLEGKYFDVIIHTAVVGGNRLQEEDESVLQTNLDMYYNIINNKEHFGRFISFGSGAELGWPTTPYGYSKRIIAESMLKRDYCLNLRIFAVFDENELDRRFIKASIKNYINHQPITIHQDKYMDFFYMKDLVSLVRYYIEEVSVHARDIIREVDCCYTNAMSLTQIASFINNLDDYKVFVHTKSSGMGAPYVGHYFPLRCALIGLENGIIEVYNKLKNG